MSELLADLFTSLDGFAGGGIEPFFGFGGPELDAWIQEHLAPPQRIVFGRRTYELLAGLSARSDDAGSVRMTELPKLVVSNTLSDGSAWANTQVLRGDAAAAMRTIKATSEVPLRTMGSLSLVRSLFQQDLVDRFRLTIFPLLMGPDGVEPVFDGLRGVSLELVDQRVLDGRVVVLDYRVRKRE
jgi:dihydrofolate reductase